MARGGKRTYTRDANGRFASTPGGGLGAARKAARSRSGRTSTLGARTSLKKSRAKLAGKDPADQRLSTALSARAQKGAITRGSKGLKAAKVAARTQIGGGMKGGIARSRSAKSQLTGAKPAAPALRDSSRAKGSRTQLSGTSDVAAKQKGLNAGALVQQKATSKKGAVGNKKKFSTKKESRTERRTRGITPDRVARMISRINEKTISLNNQLKNTAKLSGLGVKYSKSRDKLGSAKAIINTGTKQSKNTNEQDLSLYDQHMSAVQRGKLNESPLLRNVANEIIKMKRRSKRKPKP